METPGLNLSIKLPQATVVIVVVLIIHLIALSAFTVA
jgi:hypothetical protein